MKTTSYNKILKYALLLVTLATLILSALFFFIPKNQITASAHDNHLTQNEYDFRMYNVSSFPKTTNDETKVYFNANISIPKNTEINNAIKENYYNSSTQYPGYTYETTTTTRIEYYVGLILTKDLTHYYNCLNYGSVLNNTNISKLNDWFSGCKIILSNSSSSNVFNTSSIHNAGAYGNANIEYDGFNNKENYFAFSVIIKYTREDFKTSSGVTTSEGLYVTNKTENYLEFNEEESVKNHLTAGSFVEDYQLKAFQEYFGCYNPGNTTINVNYIKMKSLTEYEESTVSFTMEGIYAQSKTEVIRSLYNSLASQGFDDLSSFNATFTDTFVDASGIKHQLAQKTVRTAIDLEFNPDLSQNLTQTVNVVYQDFDYSNLVLYVSNNGYEIDSELLVMPVYTSKASGSNYVTVTFDFDDIENQLKTTLNWLFDLKKKNVQVNGVDDQVYVNVTENDIQISFWLGYQNKLFGLSLTALAEIIPDYQLTYRFNYAELDKDLNETIKTSAPYTVWYSEFVDIKYSDNFYTIHGDVIDSAINPSVLNGQKYYTFNSVTSNIDKENATAVIDVIYNYNTMFKAISSSGEVYYTPVSKNNLVYKFKELNFEIPKDYRVSNITGNDGFSLEYNDVNPAESIITVNVATNLKKLLTLNVTITDKWIVKVDYLEQYKTTPFAELKTKTIEAKISDFDKSIYNFEASDVQKLLNKSTLTLLSSQPEKINVTFDNVSTYTIRIDYSFASVTQIDYDGNQTEIKVPLTSYAEWLAFYGKDWSILFLNNQQQKYFQYSNEIASDKLYGYFSVAVFEEQVSDLNYYFQNNTGDGCMSFYNSKEVKGSDLYKFFGSLQDSVLFGTGYVGMALCEIANNENAIYESYFFFLDNTSDLPFISNSGADGQDDTDSALGNTGEDIGDALNDAGTWFNDFFTGIGDFFGWVGSIFLILIIVGAIVFIIFISKK